MKNLSLVLLLALSACSTLPQPHPEQVPVIDAKALPALKLSPLKPQTVDLSIHNNRKVNADAGNSAQVEGALRDALSQSLARGGLTVDANSPNKMSVVIDDCAKTDPNLECVNLKLSIVSGKFRAETSGFKSNGMKRSDGTTIPGQGNISQAYQENLIMRLDALPEAVKTGTSSK